MAKRLILMLTLTAVFIAAGGYVKFRQFQEAAGQAAAFQPPPEAVTTIVAQQETGHGVVSQPFWDDHSSVPALFFVVERAAA